MCAARKFDKKTRRIYAAAYVCMLAGMLPAILDLPLHQHRALYDAIRGLLLGIAIGLFLWVLRLKNRPAPPANGHA